MSDVVKELDTEELINYLRRRDLKLKDAYYKILQKEEITGLDFLELTKEDFHSIGFALGPATKFIKLIGELKEQKIRSFSSYKTVDELKELLRRYRVNGEEITNIKQFNPGKNFNITLILTNHSMLTILHSPGHSTRFYSSSWVSFSSSSFLPLPKWKGPRNFTTGLKRFTDTFFLMPLVPSPPILRIRSKPPP